MTSVERYYHRWGYVRGPSEGLFSFRHRCEWCSGTRTRDANPLRERLYEIWLYQTGLERHRVPLTDHILEGLMDRVAAQFDNVMGDGSPLTRTLASR